MLRNLLSNLNLNNTKFETIMKMTIEDIKFNRTSFGKRKTLKDMLSIVLRRCIDLDGTTQRYNWTSHCRHSRAYYRRIKVHSRHKKRVPEGTKIKKLLSTV